MRRLFFEMTLKSRRIPNTHRAGGSVQLMTAIVTNRQSQNTNRRRESARLRFVNCCVVQLPCDSRAALLSAGAPAVEQCGKVISVDCAVFVEITELEDGDARVEEEILRG